MQVVPITSNVGRLFPSEAYVLVRDDRRKAMSDQIATVSNQRLKEHIGELTPADMRSVEHAIAIQLESAEPALLATSMTFQALVGISTVSSIGQQPLLSVPTVLLRKSLCYQ